MDYEWSTETPPPPNKSSNYQKIPTSINTFRIQYKLPLTEP